MEEVPILTNEQKRKLKDKERYNNNPDAKKEQVKAYRLRKKQEKEEKETKEETQETTQETKEETPETKEETKEVKEEVEEEVEEVPPSPPKRIIKKPAPPPPPTPKKPVPPPTPTKTEKPKRYISPDEEKILHQYNQELLRRKYIQQSRQRLMNDVFSY
jgi:uncharacterized protein with von Willebrand factor type A (vWA) domain